MKAYLDTMPWVRENYLVPIPWRDVELPKTLKIGVMWSDGIVKPHPPIHRALSQVANALKSVGFEVVNWEPKEHDHCWKLTSALYYEDGGDRLRDMLKKGDEQVLPLTEWLLGQEEVKARSVEEVWDVSITQNDSMPTAPTDDDTCQLKAKRNAYRSMYNQHWLDTGKDDGHPVDAILCPVGPGCAPPHDQARYWSYTSQWNLLEYPAISFPVGQVDTRLDVPNDDYVPMNELDRFNHDLYTTAERYVDAPVSLQLVTRRYEDEKCIAVLREIEAVLKRGTC